MRYYDPNLPKAQQFLYLSCDFDDAETWKYVKLERVCKYAKSDKGLFLVFGGSGTRTLSSTRSYGRTMRSQLGSFVDDTNLVCVNYSQSAALDKGVENNIQNLVNVVFEPLVSKNSAEMKTLAYTTIKDFERKSHTDKELAQAINDAQFNLAKTNLRKITMLGHCYGAYVVLPVLENKLISAMHKYNYTDNQIAEMLKQVACATFASKTDLQHFTELNCTSFTDLARKNDARALWENFLQSLSVVNISPSERKYLQNKYKKAQKHYHSKLSFDAFLKIDLPWLVYNSNNTLRKWYKTPQINLNFVNRYLRKHDRVFVFKENSHKACLASGRLTTTNYIPEDPSDDHLLSFYHFDEQYHPHYTASTKGEYVARALSTFCIHSIATKNKPLQLDTIVQDINHFVTPLNMQQAFNLPKEELFNLERRSYCTKPAVPTPRIEPQHQPLFEDELIPM